MDVLLGVLRTLLPARYWRDSTAGAYLSILLTAILGSYIGYSGFFEHAEKAGREAATLALNVGISGAPGMDPTTAVRTALQSNVLVPFAFFLFTPLGWLADYLFMSAIYRGISLAADQPAGDPILTFFDRIIRRERDAARAGRAAAAREKAEGPVVSDQILECRKFAGKDADYVIVSSRVKEGWTPLTTVLVGAIRLRVGEPRELTMEGLLRTCYPVLIIRDLQVDRRIVHYAWPADAPRLRGLAEDDPGEDAPEN